MGVFAKVNSPSNIHSKSPSSIHSKSTDKLKSMMSFKGGASDDREEGEIIDEYEDIISSDEEFSMRQRIEELEAKNAELEKIATISAIYASGSYDYTKKDSSNHHSDRYPLISIDISDEEEYPPPPSMTRITKRRRSSSRRKMVHATSNSGHRRRKKSSSPPPPPPYHPSDKLLLSMFHEKYAARSSSKKRRKNKKSHSTKPTRRERDCQYISDDYTLDSYNLDVDDGFENYNSSDEEAGSFSINRDELRLALARNTHRHEQHVSLRDRLIRRKENTDTLNEKSVDDVQEIVEVEDASDNLQEKPEDAEDNMEEQELRIIALKSAVIRKHLVRKKRNENVAYSPSDFDEAYANISVSPSINIEDGEPCMEISPVPSPKIAISDDDGIDTKPVDMDIVNSDSDCELPYEKWLPIEQIPLPNNIVIQDELYVPTPLRYNAHVEHQQFMPPGVKFESALHSPVNLDSDVEEEELALRALLLSKMNSPKVNKIVVEKRPKIEERHSPDADTSLEAEALRNFLINNMKKKTQPRNSSASVLKEAVRRLTARNGNSSPMENFSEISPNPDKYQTVSALSMKHEHLHDTEDQLSQSTADFAKIQIGQGGPRPSKVEQGWTLWDADEGYSNVKFHLSPEEVKADSNDELGAVVSNAGLKAEQATFKDLHNEVKSKSKLLDKKHDDSKEADCDKSEVCCLSHPQSENAADFVSEGVNEENDKESSIVDVTTSELNTQEGEGTGKTIVQKEQCIVEQGKDSALELETREIIRAASPLVKSPGGEGVSKTGSPSALVEPEHNVIVEIERDTPNRIRVKSFASSKVTRNSKDSGTQHVEGKSSKDSIKTEVPMVASEAMKDSQVDVLSSLSCSSSEADEKQKPSPSPPTESTPSENEVKIDERISNAQQETNRSKDKEIKKEKEPPLSDAKEGKENTAITNKPAPKLQPKVQKPKSIAPKQAFAAKTLRHVQGTQKPQSKMPVQQATKIVKPNKVINNRVIDLKRPHPDSSKPAVPAKIAKLDESSNRLITAAEMPQVKKLVIQLRVSESESEYSSLSDERDDDDSLDARDRDLLNRSIQIGNEYYDIASPISLPMESPCDTPTRTASPLTSVTPQPIVEKSIVNDFFEAQLDKFLKNVRSKVSDSSNNPVESEESTPAAVSTPVAVRHLPEASQREYRRLVNRMKMLERQKQAKNLQVIVKNTPASAAAETRIVIGEGESLVRKVLVKNASVSTAKSAVQVKNPEKQTPQVLKTPAPKPKTPERASIPVAVPKKVPPSPISSPPKTAMSPVKAIPPTMTKPTSLPSKQSNQKLLELYEKTYRDTGNSIISNLDRSIEMVTVAKKAKMEKLKHEQRLMELRKEMEEVQSHIRQHQERISKIYPEICNSHRIIETLKNRRVKIHKDVTQFGKRIVGQSYSMNNDQKAIISEKSKKLAAEIRLVNSMKINDIEKWQSPARQTSQTDTAAIVVASVQIPATENASPKASPPNDDVLPADDSKAAVIETQLPKVTSKTEPELTNTIVPEKMSNEPKMDEDQTGQDQKESTNGHEEALENERPVENDKHNSKDHEEEKEGGDAEEEVSEDVEKEGEDLKACENEKIGGTKFQDYVSPLGHLRDERQINPNGIVCPYQLMGQCGDKDCKYMHLDN